MDERERLLDASTSEVVAEFSAYYRADLARLVAFLLWQGARLADAADIAQDTMAKAYAAWPTIGRPAAWTRTVASRERARRMAELDVPMARVPEPSAVLRSATDVEAWEQRQDVLRLLDLLPGRQRQVMAWTLDGFTPAEIAGQLRIEPAAVRASLKKARRRLAELLKGRP
ncbi:RNA polymerase sigma factor [Saccharothrix stipae]